jgi:hypothetical protein
VSAYKVRTGRTLSDALRELAASMNFETLLGGEPLRHGKNACRVAKRLVLAEARRLENESKRAMGSACLEGLARGGANGWPHTCGNGRA